MKLFKMVIVYTADDNHVHSSASLASLLTDKTVKGVLLYKTFEVDPNTATKKDPQALKAKDEITIP